MLNAATMARLWLRRLGWLVLLWIASISALALVAALLRLLMSAVGMTV